MFQHLSAFVVKINSLIFVPDAISLVSKLVGKGALSVNVGREVRETGITRRRVPQLQILPPWLLLVCLLQRLLQPSWLHYYLHCPPMTSVHSVLDWM
jgi:hypothetical protein